MEESPDHPATELTSREGSPGRPAAEHEREQGNQDDARTGLYHTDTVGCKPMAYFGTPGCRTVPRSYSRQHEQRGVGDTTDRRHEAPSTAGFSR